MIVGDRIVLPVVCHRTVIHMGGGDAFTVWEPVERMRRIWQRALWRKTFIEIHGVTTYGLNPMQVVMMEGRRR